MIVLLVMGLVPPVAQAAPRGETIDAIRVTGLVRLEAETVKSYLSVREGDSFNTDNVRESLKSLYQTGLFKDVEMEREGDALVVRVVENPMVSEVRFEGSDALSEDDLKEMTKLKVRDIYHRARAEKDLAMLRQAYRIKGLFLAKVDMEVQPQDENRVALVYRIDEGEKSKVRAVRVVGNEGIAEKDLIKKLMTQPSGWLSWFTDDDIYDREKLLFDQEQVRNHYLDNGYARAQVDTSVAELTPDRRAFVITHTVREGALYNFGEIKITGDFNELAQEELEKSLQVAQGQLYSREGVRKSIEKLTDQIGDFGYAFLDIRPKTVIDDQGKLVHITFDVTKGQRVYVNRIEVTGNSRTRDEVVRREVLFAEGDRFSSTRMRESKQRLTNLDFFEKVEITQPLSEVADRMDVKINVEEKPTGTFTVGAGYSSTEKIMGTASISQNNFLGRGQRMKLSFALSANTDEYDISFTEPYFMGENISAGFDLFSIQSDQTDMSAYWKDTKGASFSLGFSLAPKLRDSLTYSLAKIKLTIDDDNTDDVSARITAEAEDSPYVQSMISNTLTWNNIDNRMLPTEGRSHRLSTDFAGLGGDVHFVRLLTDHSLYRKLEMGKDWVGHLRGRAGIIQGLGEDVPIYERWFLGGSKSVRGFDSGGIGPRLYEGDDAYGGTYFGQVNMEVLFPFLGLADKGVRGFTFMDVGYVGSLDNPGSEVRESTTPSVGVGVGVNWNSPFGPLNFSLGVPILKEDFDKTQMFDFSIGTTM